MNFYQLNEQICEGLFRWGQYKKIPQNLDVGWKITNAPKAYLDYYKNNLNDTERQEVDELLNTIPDLVSALREFENRKKMKGTGYEAAKKDPTALSMMHLYQR